MWWIFAIVAVMLLFAFLKLHSKARKPLKLAVVNMSIGIVTLVVIAQFTSVLVNVYTVFMSLALGIPGALLITSGTFWAVY
ncbi:MAG: pro-sigmaK processing inhibitor BofA family protein [Oscillospiraceae bacterium]|nr:pro-sigmaK processing inhibitor BofA family protein [Oscillospiraceae bacterium]